MSLSHLNCDSRGSNCIDVAIETSHHVAQNMFATPVGKSVLGGAHDGVNLNTSFHNAGLREADEILNRVVNKHRRNITNFHQTTHSPNSSTNMKTNLDGGNLQLTTSFLNLDHPGMSTGGCELPNRKNRIPPSTYYIDPGHVSIKESRMCGSLATFFGVYRTPEDLFEEAATYSDRAAYSAARAAGLLKSKATKNLAEDAAIHAGYLHIKFSNFVLKCNNKYYLALINNNTDTTNKYSRIIQKNEYT